MLQFLGSGCLLIYVVGAISIGLRCASAADQFNQRWVNAPVQLIPWRAFVDGAAMPWSSRPIGEEVIQTWARVAAMQQPAPIDFIRRIWFKVGAVFACAVTVPVVLAAVLFLLPQSRRRAKVRFVHILRILVYGVVPLGIPVAILFLSIPTNASALQTLGMAALVLAVPMNFMWWCVAMRAYLRLDHMPAIAASMAVIGLLWIVIVSMGFEGYVW